jgi:hypothetical protein
MLEQAASFGKSHIQTPTFIRAPSLSDKTSSNANPTTCEAMLLRQMRRRWTASRRSLAVMTTMDGRRHDDE